MAVRGGVARLRALLLPRRADWRLRPALQRGAPACVGARRGRLRETHRAPSLLLLLGGAIVASLLVSTHTWWARYGPHLWWLPIFPVAAALRAGGALWLRRAAAAIALLLLADALLVGAVHMRWEWRSTQALRAQLSDLRQAGPLTVDLAYFDVPVARRFQSAGIAFVPTSTRTFACSAERRLTLMSVCRGYPEWIRICLQDQARATSSRRCRTGSGRPSGRRSRFPADPMRTRVSPRSRHRRRGAARIHAKGSRTRAANRRGGCRRVQH